MQIQTGAGVVLSKAPMPEALWQHVIRDHLHTTGKVRDKVQQNSTLPGLPATPLAGSSISSSKGVTTAACCTAFGVMSVLAVLEVGSRLPPGPGGIEPTPNVKIESLISSLSIYLS